MQGLYIEYLKKQIPKMSAGKYMNKYRIKSMRKPNWDYRTKAIYFVTICTQHRVHYFGNIKKGKIILSDIGQIATTYWFDIPNHFPFIELINFVVMPNHVHGLLEIHGNDDDIPKDPLHATDQSAMGPPNKNESMVEISPKRGSLSSVIRSYKSAVTRYANQNKIEFGWQSRFHDHIVKDGNEFYRIYEYISNNPRKIAR
jgi:REP-associated tyrosine transposase